jgi:hypothetical protein
MPTVDTNRLHDAHYHPIKVTQAWAAFVALMGGEAQATIAKRKARDAQRRRETTYARGELGGS